MSGQLTRLSQAMDKAAADHERSTKLVDDGIHSLQQLAQDLNELQGSTDNMLRKIEAYTDMLTRNQNTSDEVLEKMASTLESIDIVSRQQTTHLKNVNAVQREMMAGMDEFRAATETFMHKVHEATGRTAEGMHMAADEMNAVSSQLARTQQELTGQINADLKDAFDSFEQYMAEFTRRIDQVGNAIAGSISQLPKAVGETSNQFLDEMDRLTDALRAANDRMAKR